MLMTLDQPLFVIYLNNCDELYNFCFLNVFEYILFVGPFKTILRIRINVKSSMSLTKYIQINVYLSAHIYMFSTI